MSLSPTPFAIVLLLAALPALAYETDQLTHRDRLLVDARGPANQEVNRQLSLAVAHTNDRLGCDASAESTRRHLATEIHRLLARPTSAPDRGSFDSMGFGAYGAFLERAPIARRDFVDHSDIYGGLKPAQSFILASVESAAPFASPES